MLRLIYSNRTEELLSQLAARVRAQQATVGALTPARIVAQSAPVMEYLRRGIARECGVAANLQTMPIARFAAETIAQTTGLRVADAEAFEAMALVLLLDESFIAEVDLSPVRAHLAGGQSGESADVRRVALAARVGYLFEEYAHSRSEMLLRWLRATTLDGRHVETERWQRRLWLAMFGDQGLARSRGLVPLHEAMAELPRTAVAPLGTAHVFCFAHFAPVFHELFAHIARVDDLFIYSLSPCEGFWEDFDERDPLPLQLWGRPGREQVRALNAAAAFDHEDRFVEPQGGALLARLQRDILRRSPAPTAADHEVALASDESVILLEHASIRRELEVVASEIWRLLEIDPTLSFDDIAVLVPSSDAVAYLAHLPAVFRESNDIPHQVADIATPGDASIVEAVELLLSLPLGRFTRQDLLRLAVHPAVVASLDDVDPGRWLAWCSALGIVHGADRGDHEDTYIERDILNWDQGLRRLALGAFMAGDPSGERRPYELAGELYVPHEVAASDMRDAAALGLLVRSLVADARFVQGAELLLSEWAMLLCCMVETYVAPTTDLEAERLAACLRRVHAIGKIDLDGRRVPYRVACELARGRLASLERGLGAEGVVVSRLASVQPIPFRVVFVCGMGEGRFPSADADDPLDLRRARRREGDVTARERDKYAFLEALLGTRDRLYVSHVSRDPLTGDALAASSVVQEFLHAIGRAYVSNVSALRRRHPLRRWDPRYFPEFFPLTTPTAPALGTIRLTEARAEARTLALRRSMEERGTRVDAYGIDERGASDETWAALARHLRIASVPRGARPPEARVPVPMRALIKFLDFPLQGWARFRVGLDEIEEEDPLACEDEPFETHVRDETLLLRSVLFAASAKGSLEAAYDDVVRDRELRGSGPSGVFAQGERGEHLHTLAQWKERLDALHVPLEAIEVHRFGRAGEHAAADHAHPPLIVEVDVADAAGVVHLVRAEIAGRTLPLWSALARTSITLARRGKEGTNDWVIADRQRAMLRAFVDHAVLSASGVAEGLAHSSVIVVASPEGAIAERISFEPLSRGEALVWLRGLVRELLGGPHAYFFPSEAVFVSRGRGGDGHIVATLEAARDMLRDGDGPLALRSAYGPVPRPHRYRIPGEVEAAAMIAQRFGAIFQKCTEGA